MAWRRPWAGAWVLPDRRGVHALCQRYFLGACGPVRRAAEALPRAWAAPWGGCRSPIPPNHPERVRTATTRDPTFASIRIHVGLENRAI